ncbi:MAG: dTDP-4-dehydrorhamnose 3,5-epimerase [Muribaculaceae bacterium]|nr:dTDP-4-dehydrorhamnose 3,5-epimerase [Muribaculaceae bacterium]
MTDFIKTSISGVWIIEPQRFGDARGYFCETFRLCDFRNIVGPVEFVQENESFSSGKVIRGLHLQRGDAAQAKLVRVSRGRVLDVAVDLRKGSDTFGRYVAVELSADNGRQLFVPRGFAHGFAVLGDEAQFQYKVDNYYAPEAELCLRFDDPAIGIEWPFDPSEALLSPKDLQGLSFDEICKKI